MTNVHIVNHTHWDREWYFTSMDALVLSDQLFSDAIEELQNHPEASFVLDGQLSILDDYLQLYPEKMGVIRELVDREQLFIGPWYTQSDAFFASGEAILRNAMIGIFESKKYGSYMPIGYLPDTFGFNAQIPTILKEAGFKSVIMWRGLDLKKHVNSPYFKWAGMNGKEYLTALNFPHGYGTGMLLEPTVEYVDGRLDKAVDFIKQFTDSDVLIPSGNDQLAIIHDFSKKLEEINKLGKYDYQVSTYRDFIKYAETQNLEKYVGELREPVLARVHKTIGSVRMDLKQAIFHLEDKLTYRIEPLMVIAQKAGLQMSNRLLMLAWKKLLESQAHDSLAGCVSDAVAEDIKHRLKEADEICDSIENTIMKQISDYLELKPNEVLVVNPSPNHFKGKKIVTVLSSAESVHFNEYPSEVIDVEYVDSRENILEEIPAGKRYITEPGYYILRVAVECELAGLGYQVLTFEEIENISEFSETNENKIHGNKITVTFEDGKVNLLNNGVEFADFITLVDQSNAGDTYDYSPLAGDVSKLLRFTSCRCLSGKESQSMILSGVTKLPLTLDERKIGIESTDFQYELVLTIANDDTLTGKVTFENTVLNHRVRLQLKNTQEFVSTKAGLPFGFITRQNRSVEGWQEKYSEMPVNVEPFEKIVSGLSDGYSFNLFTCDSKEYEYQGENLWVTIIATTDSLGKPDLMYRPGRASGDTTMKGHILMDTPLAQQKDQLIEFNFNFVMDNAEVSEASLSDWKSRLLQPSISYQKQDFNYFVHRIDNKIQKFEKELKITEKSLSLLDFQTTGYYVSSVHRSYYDNQAFVIRFENPTDQEMELPLESMFENYEFKCVNAVEDEVQATNKIDPYDVLTVLVK